MVKKKVKEDLKLEELKRDEDGKYIVELQSPIKFGDRTINHLAMSEPKAKHLRKLPSDPGMDDILNVVGDLCAEPDSVIDELSMKDVNTCAEFFQAFE